MRAKVEVTSMNKEIYLQFILPNNSNFAPCLLMRKRAKEEPDKFSFSWSYYGLALLSYQGTLYKYDSYEIRKECPLKDDQTIILKLIEA